MKDIVSKHDIVSSMLESTPAPALLVDGAALRDFSAWVRASVQHGAWKVGVETGDLPAWQRAFAHVVCLQDALRAFAGRLRCGAPRDGVSFEERVVGGATNPDGIVATMCAYEGEPEAPPPKSVVRVIPNADVAGYVYDPSWTNGGIAAHNENRADAPIGVKERHVHGIAAFRSVEAIGGIPELAWFFCGSAFELGMASSFDGMLATLLNGGAMGESSTGTSPKGPGDLARAAAADQRRILALLAGLAHRHQRSLRLAYTDQRYEAKLVRRYGLGVAPIVWRAQQDAGETQPGPGTLARLVAIVREDWPTYDGETAGDSEELESRIARAAELVLDTAHRVYLVAATPAPSAASLARRACRLQGRAKTRMSAASGQKRKPREKERPDLVPQGQKGRSKRRLVELHAVAIICDGDEPRAA